MQNDAAAPQTVQNTTEAKLPFVKSKNHMAVLLGVAIAVIFVIVALVRASLFLKLHLKPDLVLSVSRMKYLERVGI